MNVKRKVLSLIRQLQLRARGVKVVERYDDNPSEWFDGRLVKTNFSESRFIGGSGQPEVRYRYSLMESALIETFAKYNVDLRQSNVLDIGTGLGHWIDFYTEINARSVMGIDFARLSIEILAKKYRNFRNVSLKQVDIGSSEINIEGKFDVINAIGIFFHIVDDSRFSQAIQNLRKVSHKDSILIVSGFFPDEGWREESRQIRSLDTYQQLLSQNGFKILELRKISGHGPMEAIIEKEPKNNLLIFQWDDARTQ